MPSDSALEVIRRQLFGVDEQAGSYGIFDGASMPDLLPMLDEDELESVCLLPGELDEEMEQVAPYLVCMTPDSPFSKWVLKDGWGKHWGIFVRSKTDMMRMRMHFRAMLKVQGPDFQPLYFRYYDPRVLRVYLPTCTGEELNTVFGPAEHFLMEGEKPEMLLRFGLAEDGLKYEEFLLT